MFIIVALAAGCSSASASAPGTVDAGASDADDTSETGSTDVADAPAGCRIDAVWAFERIGDGSSHAIAAGADGRLHALSLRLSRLEYRVRSAGGTWSPVEISSKTPAWTDDIRMAVSATGGIVAVARGSSTFLQRTAAGEWLSEEVTSLSGSHPPWIVVDGGGVVHVTNGSGGVQLPRYARRATDGTWSTPSFASSMKGAETTAVAVIASGVTVCSIVFPYLMCVEGDGVSAFGTPATVGKDATHLHLLPDLLLAISGGPAGSSLRLHRRSGGTWSLGTIVDDAAGIWGGSDAAVDASGDLHVVQHLLITIAKATYERALRYVQVAADGKVKAQTIACDSEGLPNVEVLPDRRVFVSYAQKGGIFVGTP